MGANCCNQQSTTTSDQVLDFPVLESTYDDEGGQKKREFHDGLYFGQLTGTRRNGFGTMEYTNGDKYEGEWVENDRQGTGLVNYSGSQNSFKGEWFQDKPHGRGVYQSQDDGSSRTMVNSLKAIFMEMAKRSGQIRTSTRVNLNTTG